MVAFPDCIRYVREGDVVRVALVDRLARSLGDLREIVDEITGKGASVVFVKEQQNYSRDTDDAIGQLMLNLPGAFAEFERTLIRKRQREGIGLRRRVASTRAALRSSPLSSWSTRPSNKSGVPKAKVARDLQVDRTTLYRELARGPVEAPPGE